MRAAAILFIVFRAFFELVLSPFRLDTRGYLFPILLIVLGGYIIVERSGLGIRKEPSDQEPTSGNLP